jgi:hypothetical protein
VSGAVGGPEPCWLPRMNAKGALLEQPELGKRPAVKTTDKQRGSADLARALSCPVCQAAGIVNRLPTIAPTTRSATAVNTSDVTPTSASDSTGEAKTPKPVLVLTAGQARFLQRGFDYLATEGPGADPDARLLALICLLRAARSGKANLVAQDVTGLRVTDPRATIAALTDNGWLVTTPQLVLAADSVKPAACTVPMFTDPPNPWAVGKNIRTRASGWTTRLLSNKLLRKKPNTVRITALYLTAHAAPDGRIEFTPEHLLNACALGGRTGLVLAIKTLLDIGWLAECRPGTAGLEARLAEAVLPLAAAPPPPPTPPNPAKSTSPAKCPATRAAATDVPIAVEAAALIAGREAELTAWVEAFRAEHGHGPSWAVLAAAQGWSREYGRPRAVSSAALMRLHSSGWLEGLRKPYGMRPGPKYRQLRHAGEQTAPSS